METVDRPSAAQLMGAGILNLIVLGGPTIGLSGALMQVGSHILSQEIAWPQIAFMSAYPDDVRNGYVLFVIAVLVIVFVSSGLFAGLFGASPGKVLAGIGYVRRDGGRAGLTEMLVRAGLLILLLLPILLVGPLLGFLFGPSADPYSLLALGLSFFLFVALAFPWRGRSSWVNRVAGVEPVRRRSLRAKSAGQ